MADDDTSLPLAVDSRLLTLLQRVILFVIKIMAVMMTLVIIWSVIDLGYRLFEAVLAPPILLVAVDDILRLFGSFLIVLIAVEIFINIISYFKRSAHHLRLVVATALMAIARKVIILDYDTTSHTTLWAMGVVIVALAIAYWLVSVPQIKSNVLPK